MFHRFKFEFWPRTERIFQKGDFKYLILGLLKDKSRYGYEIIRDLEDKFHGFYSPSPGAVYPTLQWLEEMGYVTSSQKDRKKIYTITEEGRHFLSEREQETEDIKSQMKNWFNWWNPEIHEKLHDIMHIFSDIGLLLRQKTRTISAEKLRRIKEVILKTQEEIENILKT